MVAQTPEGAYGFTDGWVRLRLASCPGAHGDRTHLEVEGADAVLLFKPGRPGGATLGVLAPLVSHAPVSMQPFPVPAASNAAREVVLAPVSDDPKPTLTRLRLVAAP